MDARQARKLVERKLAADKKRADEANAKRASDLEAAYNAGRKAGEAHLATVLAEIRKAAATGQTQFVDSVTRQDENNGSRFLAGVRDVLVPRLQAKKFKVVPKLDRRGGTIYEGVMDREAVGWEYSCDELTLTISWE